MRTRAPALQRYYGTACWRDVQLMRNDLCGTGFAFVQWAGFARRL
jgi:hypothetical protein